MTYGNWFWGCIIMEKSYVNKKRIKKKLKKKASKKKIDKN